MRLLPRYIPIVTEVLSGVREFVERSVMNDEPMLDTFLDLTVPNRADLKLYQHELERLYEAIENDAPEGTKFFRLIEDESGRLHLGYMASPFESVSHPIIDESDVDDPNIASVYQYVFDEDSETVEYQHVGYFMRDLPE